MNRKIAVWLPLVLWLAVIFYFSTIPPEPGPPGEGIDISNMHLPVYFLLSVLFLRLFLTGGYEKYGFALAVAFSTVYGLVMEVFQLFMPGRFFSYYDILLNFIGSCLVLIFVPRMLRKFF